MPYLIGQIQSSEDVTETATNNATPFMIKNIAVMSGENGWIQLTYCAVDNAANGAVKIKMARYKRTIAGLITIVTPTNLYVPTADTGMTTADITLTVNADAASININVVGVAAKDIKHRIQFVKNAVVLEDFATTF